MNQPATMQLRLPRSVKNGVERLAKREGVSMNQLMATAIAEKVAVLETLDYLEERAKRADMDSFWRFLNRPGGEPPREGDELPEGYVSVAKRGT